MKQWNLVTAVLMSLFQHVKEDRDEKFREWKAVRDEAVYAWKRNNRQVEKGWRYTLVPPRLPSTRQIRA